MHRLREAMWRLYGFLFSLKVDRRIEREFSFHLEMRTRDNLAAGMSPEEAHKDALNRFGNQTYLAEAAREIRGVRSVDSVLQDFRYGARMLLKHPAFTTVAVLTMALGIAANTAIFSVVHAVLISPPPYGNSERLMIIWSSLQKMGATRAPASGFELREIKDRSQLFQDVAGVWVGNGTLTGETDPEQVKVGRATANVFSVLAVNPSLGRGFLREEEGSGSRAAIILGHGLWVRRYGADPNIIGTTIRLDGQSRTVVGVMPPDFKLLFSPDADVPADIQAWIAFPYDISKGPRDLYYLRLIGRLKPGVTVAQAQDEANSISQQLCSEFGEFGRETLGLEIVPLHSDAVRTARPALLALLIGAALLLLISCANVANLLLTRATVRRREVALRAALGASRWRIIRQLLVESLMLCGLSGALGLLLGWWGLRFLLTLQAINLPQLGAIPFSSPMIFFVAAVSLAAGLLCGLAPVSECTRLSLVDVLKGSSRSRLGGGASRTRSLLIVSEVAVGFVLIVGAGLMARTLAQLERVDPGFSPAGVLTFEVNLPSRGYPTDKSRIEFVEQTYEKLSSLRGVESAGAISHLPLDDYPNWYGPYTPEGVLERDAKGLLADTRTVTPEYFSAIGARLVDGRLFDGRDQPASPNVVIIDDLLARRTWPGQSAVGKKLQVEHYIEGNFLQRWAEVVGVVNHIRSQSLTADGRGQIYIPYTKSARPHLSYLVRTSGDPMALVSSVRGEISSIDKDLALSKVRPMTDYVSKARARTDFTAVLSCIFAGAALLLASVGIYGVVSYSASQRTQEIGIRMAMGAQRADVMKLVVRGSVLLATAGIAIGVLAALVLTRFMAGLLYGVSATDPATFVGVSVLLMAVALFANYFPARRATRVEPLTALRCD
jgi:predicted permease